MPQNLQQSGRQSIVARTLEFPQLQSKLKQRIEASNGKWYWQSYQFLSILSRRSWVILLDIVTVGLLPWWLTQLGQAVKGSERLSLFGKG